VDFSCEEPTMKVKPLYDRVLVQRLELEEKTRGGIIIPDSAKEKPLEGRVVAVGTGRVLKNGEIRPLSIAEGNRVLFGKYAGTEIKIDGDELLILKEDDLFAVIED
jgi:chaperonin GroES